MIEYLTTKLALYLPAILWFGFVASIVAGNSECAFALVSQD
jgi:hypothetical protein